MLEILGTIAQNARTVSVVVTYPAEDGTPISFNLVHDQETNEVRPEPLVDYLRVAQYWRDILENGAKQGGITFMTATREAGP